MQTLILKKRSGDTQAEQDKLKIGETKKAAEKLAASGRTAKGKAEVLRSHPAFWRWSIRADYAGGRRRLLRFAKRSRKSSEKALLTPMPSTGDKGDFEIPTDNAGYGDESPGQQDNEPI